VVRLDDASGESSRAAPHDPSVASRPGENAHRFPSRMCSAVASASTRDARTPSRTRPARSGAGYPGVARPG
jgi:hypothetical protein